MHFKLALIVLCLIGCNAAEHSDKKTEPENFSDQISTISLDSIGTIQKGVLNANKKYGAWVTIDSSKTVLDAKLYYADTILFDLDPKDYYFQKVDLWTGVDSISLQIPMNWRRDFFPEPNDIMIAMLKVNSGEPRDPSFIFHRIRDNTSSLATFMEGTIAGITKSADKYHFMDTYSAKISNRAFIKKTILLTKSSEEICHSVFILEDTPGHFLRFIGTSYNDETGAVLKYKDLFEDIFFSLRLN